MATDYAEKERAFVASLAEDSGKGLDDWMRAVTGAKLENRNDIIDWLRLQGFTFARASWLERIHHNGGRLIYSANPAAKPIPSEPAREPPEPNLATAAAAATPTDEPARGRLNGDVAALLLAAKGLRPLAELILREIGQSVPNTVYEARAPLIYAAAPKPFAALLPAAKQLKIYADFGAATPQIKTADFLSTSAAPFPGMLVLSDARMVDQSLLALIAAAHARAHA